MFFDFYDVILSDIYLGHLVITDKEDMERL